MLTQNSHKAEQTRKKDKFNQPRTNWCTFPEFGPEQVVDPSNTPITHHVGWCGCPVRMVQWSWQEGVVVVQGGAQVSN